MDEEIKKLVEENLKLTQEIYTMTKKMKNYIALQRVMSFIYFLIIVVPIILSIIYLPPLINNMLNQYGGILGVEGLNLESIFKGGISGLDSNNIDLNNLNTNSLSPAARKELQKIIDNNPNLKNIDINKLPPELQKEAQKYLNK